MHKPTRTRLILIFLAGFACSLLIFFANQFLARKPLDLAKLANYSAEELIDGLQDEATEGLGTHSTAWADGFIASTEGPRFRGGMLGTAKPVVSLVMKELVSRGVTAMPELLDHLTDRRLTHLVIKLPHDFIGAMWHSDEYDPRHPDKKPSRVNTRDDNLKGRYVRGEGYRIRVGDLCYVAIGQIVNRRLNVVRYQPTACVVVNSPVETPTLAAAVRKDWSGLTADEHERSLMQDAQDSTTVEGAFMRLRFYYPRNDPAFVPRPEEGKEK